MKTKSLAIALLLAAAIIPCRGAEPGAPVNLSFDLLKKTVVKETDGNLKIEYPKELAELEGKRVVLTGFVVPLDDPGKMTKMIVFQAAVGCFYCNPPAENETVLVRRPAKSQPLQMDSDNVRVEGILHLQHPDSKDPDIKQFCFTIDDAKVTPGKN